MKKEYCLYGERIEYSRPLTDEEQKVFLKYMKKKYHIPWYVRLWNKIFK